VDESPLAGKFLGVAVGVLAFAVEFPKATNQIVGFSDVRATSHFVET
jgi:hypothetical protein